MVDIAKCSSEKCPSREICWRYISPPDLFQSFSDFESQRKPNEPRCDFFYPIPRRKKTTLPD
jgi:hypothetical protein